MCTNIKTPVRPEASMTRYALDVKMTVTVATPHPPPPPNLSNDVCMQKKLQTMRIPVHGF